MVAPTKSLNFDSATEGASVAGSFDATGGTVSLLAKATAASRSGGKGCECTGAAVSDFGSLTCASTNDQTMRKFLRYSGTPPGTAVDFMVLRNASATALTAKLTTSGTVTINDASGVIFTLNGGSALTAGDYWITMGATKGTTTSNGVAEYWLHNGQTNVQIEHPAAVTNANTGTAVFTVQRFGKHSTGGTYTVVFDRPATLDGTRGLIDLPPVHGTTTDNLGLTDSAAFTLSASTTDNLGLTDTGTGARILNASVTDNLGITDLDVVETFVVDDSATDALGLTDTADGALYLPRSAADTLGLSDTADAAIDRQASATDAIGLTDSVSGALTRPASDSLGLTDSVAFTLSQATTDALGLTDSGTGDLSGATGTTTTDALGLTDTTAETLAQSTPDNLGLTDAATGALSVNASRAETLGLTDSVTFELVQSLADTMGLTDTLTLAASFQAIIAETLGLSDSTTPTLTHGRTDALGLSDGFEFVGAAGPPPPERTYVIRTEARTFVVEAEDRTYLIPAEARILEVVL